MYLASALIFATIMSPAVHHVQEASKVDSASRAITGVQRVLDSLEPGLVVSLTYGFNGQAAQIITGVHTMTYTSGNTAVSAVTKWVLPYSTLHPGLEYFLWIAGGSVEVSRVGGS